MNMINDILCLSFISPDKLGLQFISIDGDYDLIVLALNNISVG
jgi:hypothetical protein